MSTTFGIKIDIDNKEKILAIAYRSWTGLYCDINCDPLLSLIDPNTKVIPLDNTAQGIEKVGDLLDIDKGNNVRFEYQYYFY